MVVQTITSLLLTRTFWQHVRHLAHGELYRKPDSRDVFKPNSTRYISMKTLTFPGARRRMSPYPGSHLLPWPSGRLLVFGSTLSGYGIRTQGDGWCQGRLTSATQGAWEPNQPLTGKAHWCASLLMFLRFSDSQPGHCRWIVVKSLSLFFFSPVPCFVQKTHFCSSHLSPARTPGNILGFFFHIYDDITDLSSPNCGVIVLTHIPETKLWLQVASAPIISQRPCSLGFWRCQTLL